MFRKVDGGCGESGKAEGPPVMEGADWPLHNGRLRPLLAPCC